MVKSWEGMLTVMKTLHNQYHWLKREYIAYSEPFTLNRPSISSDLNWDNFERCRIKARDQIAQTYLELIKTSEVKVNTTTVVQLWMPIFDNPLQITSHWNDYKNQKSCIVFSLKNYLYHIYRKEIHSTRNDLYWKPQKTGKEAFELEMQGWGPRDNESQVGKLRLAQFPFVRLHNNSSLPGSIPGRGVQDKHWQTFLSSCIVFHFLHAQIEELMLKSTAGK